MVNTIKQTSSDLDAFLPLCKIPRTQSSTRGQSIQYMTRMQCTREIPQSSLLILPVCFWLISIAALIYATTANTAFPSHLTVSRISAPITVTTEAVEDFTYDSGISTLEHPFIRSTSPLVPHRSISKQSFASDTGLLEHEREETTLPHRQLLQKTQSALRAVNRTSATSFDNEEIASRASRLQQRATLQRQGTDDLLPPALGYDRQSGDDSWNSAYDMGKGRTEKVDLHQHWEPSQEEHATSVRDSHAQIAALVTKRGWRRVKSPCDLLSWDHA